MIEDGKAVNGLRPSPSGTNCRHKGEVVQGSQPYLRGFRRGEREPKRPSERDGEVGNGGHEDNASIIDRSVGKLK